MACSYQLWQLNSYYLPMVPGRSDKIDAGYQGQTLLGQVAEACVGVSDPIEGMDPLLFLVQKALAITAATGGFAVSVGTTSRAPWPGYFSSYTISVLCVVRGFASMACAVRERFSKTVRAVIAVNTSSCLVSFSYCRPAVVHLRVPCEGCCLVHSIQLGCCGKPGHVRLLLQLVHVQGLLRRQGSVCWHAEPGAHGAPHC